ncbi:hypothetical protein AB0393_28755 [Streptomyces cyaneofuscatus]|uniref:hypothetical protein n=1 Tax=Streptomyces cyaneofuscatus TaxID=66883 RepID=UPI00344C0904
MPATLLTRTAPVPPPELAATAQPQTVGPGWEVLLMPEPLGRLVVDALAGRPARTAPLGWVFTHAGRWGIFLPLQSDQPAWPSCTTYLTAGASITLPPDEARSKTWPACGWVSRDGEQLSRPLLLHPVLTALAPCDAGPASCATGPPDAVAARRSGSPPEAAERHQDTEQILTA